MKTSPRFLVLALCLPLGMSRAAEPLPRSDVLAHYVDSFNKNDTELVVTTIPNAAAGDWMQ